MCRFISNKLNRTKNKKFTWYARVNKIFLIKNKIFVMLVKINTRKLHEKILYRKTGKQEEQSKV